MIRQQWAATCDATGCHAQVVLNGDQCDGKWSLGVQVNDAGWDARPGRQETYCPLHTKVADEGRAEA